MSVAVKDLERMSVDQKEKAIGENEPKVGGVEGVVIGAITTASVFGLSPYLLGLSAKFGENTNQYVYQNADAFIYIGLAFFYLVIASLVVAGTIYDRRARNRGPR